MLGAAYILPNTPFNASMRVRAWCWGGEDTHPGDGAEREWLGSSDGVEDTQGQSGDNCCISRRRGKRGRGRAQGTSLEGEKPGWFRALRI